MEELTYLCTSSFTKANSRSMGTAFEAMVGENLLIAGQKLGH